MKQKMMIEINEDDLDEQKQQWVQEMQNLMAELERKLHTERAQAEKSNQNEMKVTRDKQA